MAGGPHYGGFSRGAPLSVIRRIYERVPGPGGRAARMAWEIFASAAVAAADVQGAVCPRGFAQYCGNGVLVVVSAVID